MVDLKTGTDGILTPQLARVVGSKTGLVSTLEYALPTREDPNPESAVSVRLGLADPSELSESEDIVQSLNASGKGRTVREAVVSGVGETVERYSMMYASFDGRVTTSYDEVVRKFELPEPKYLRYFTEAERDRLSKQYQPLSAFDPSEKREWIYGTNLLSNEQTCLPAGILTRLRNEEKPLIIPVTTNGMSCHETYEQALLGSIYEYVERDAFMRTWYTKTPPTQLDINGLVTENEEYKYHFYEYDVGVDLSLVGCLGERRDGSRSFICGGAGPDIETAVYDTLNEATQCFESTMLWRNQGENNDQKIDPTTITNFHDNVSYYDSLDRLGELKFLVEGEKRTVELTEQRTFNNPDAELEYVLDVLRNEGVTPIAFDITPPEIADLGLVVTQICIPELVPLSLPSFPFDAHPKLEDNIATDLPHPYP